MFILSGDIGGTNSRLRLTNFKNFNDFEITVEANFQNQEYASFSDVVALFLKNNAIETRDIAAAAFAVAGPVVDGTVKVTNLPWTISEVELTKAFSFKKVNLLNDFEAAGYGVDNLKTEDLYVLQQGTVQPNRPRAMIGAGTGLGVAMAVSKGEHYQVIPTEGGHVDFAPMDEVQMHLLAHMQKRLHRVSAERLVSGMGILNIYKYIRENPLFNESENINLKRALFQEGDAPAKITEYAIEHHDSMAMRTLDLFIRIYGAVAGNLALTTLPFGGLYIMGGIAPKILPQLVDGRFIDALCDKGRMSNLIKTIQVSVVLNTSVGLQGAANYGYLLCQL